MKVADIKNVAGIGGGVIGGSWAVLFAMKGLNVNFMILMMIVLQTIRRQS